MINLDWFYRDGKTIIDFAKSLQGKPDQLINSEFVRAILKHFWPKI